MLPVRRRGLYLLLQCNIKQLAFAAQVYEPNRLARPLPVAQGVLRIVKRYPSTLLLPLAVLGLVLGIGVWEALRVGQLDQQHEQVGPGVLCVESLMSHARP